MMLNQKDSFDYMVVGGGMVGAAAALGLAQQGAKVALLEAHLPQAFDPSQGPDMRVSAISAGSEELLRALGAWQHIEAMRTCVYRRLAVWEDPSCRIEFDATDIGAEHLGHIIENRLVQLGLHKALTAQNIHWVNEAPAHIQIDQQLAGITLSSGKMLSAKYLVGADGAQSKVRQATGIGTQGWQYAQQVLAISVKMPGPAQDITWQQFHPSGPTAFLPLYDGYGSLVWYHSGNEVQRLKALSNAALTQAIKTHFPPELGDFEILATASFPISRMHASRYVKGPVILVGDAAHTINPLAGQGVNLGFADIKALLAATGKGPLNDRALQSFERERRAQNLLMMSTMDALYGLFSNDIAPIKLARNLGLAAVNQLPFAKKIALKQAMGI